jgi:UV excision repair protein RAD23
MQALLEQWLHTPAGHEAAHEATHLRLTPEETGQFFHARMLQSLGRMRMDTPPDLSMTADQMHQVMEALPAEAEEAVARLVGLGFERGRVIEAYIACDQDEMLAANLLMDQ